MQLSKAIIALSFAVFTSVAALPAHPDPKGSLDSQDGMVHTMDKDHNDMADRPMYECNGSRETCQKKWKSKGDEKMDEKKKKKKKKGPKGDEEMDDMKKKKKRPKKVKGPKKEKKPEEGKPEMGPKDMDDKKLETKPGKPDTKSPPGEKKHTPPGNTDPLLEENPTAP